MKPSLLLVTLLVLSPCPGTSSDPVQCLQNQSRFRESCFQFWDVPLSFAAAEGWCQRKGGHLVFIPDPPTQDFLQDLLDPERDSWIGLGRASEDPGILSQTSVDPFPKQLLFIKS